MRLYRCFDSVNSAKLLWIAAVLDIHYSILNEFLFNLFYVSFLISGSSVQPTFIYVFIKSHLFIAEIRRKWATSFIICPIEECFGVIINTVAAVVAKTKRRRECVNNLYLFQLLTIYVYACKKIYMEFIRFPQLLIYLFDFIVFTWIFFSLGFRFYQRRPNRGTLAAEGDRSRKQRNQKLKTLESIFILSLFEEQKENGKKTQQFVRNKYEFRRLWTAADSVRVHKHDRWRSGGSFRALRHVSNGFDKGKFSIAWIIFCSCFRLSALSIIDKMKEHINGKSKKKN